MTLKGQIENDFKEAYKAKELRKKDFLGLLRGAIQTEEGKLNLATDENVLKIIKTFEKGLNLTIESKRKLGQDVTQEETQLTWLTPYKPTLMSEAEMSAIVSDICSRENISLNEGLITGTFCREQKGKHFDLSILKDIIKANINTKSANVTN